MKRRATTIGRRAVLGIFVGALVFLTWSTTAWAATRLGDAELLMWYRQRHTFHSHGGEDLNWVQWRNEIFGWLIYNDFIKDGKVFDKVELPLISQVVRGATLNARYRFRYDPVYQIRDHFDTIYDDEEKDSFIIPENGFRDLFLDLDFGRVGMGRLTARVGNQQIVWGESDLFRSIDRINPLRIDQNQGAGEKFDEFRTPILALKFLYEIGNVGRLFSNVAIEPWWSPRFRTPESDLILEGAFRLPHHIRGCLDENDQLVPYDPVVCANTFSSTGERVFVPYRPGWRGVRNIRHPWSIFPSTPNPRDGTPDFACTNQRCSPDIFGDRQSLIANLNKGRFKHVLTGWGQHAGGFRVLGTSRWGVDFSLNYMYTPSSANGVFDMNQIFEPDGSISPDRVYGDFGIFTDADGNVIPPAGSFQEGLRRCLSDNGKNHQSEGKQGEPGARGHKAGATLLTGADLLGYNHPQRFRSNNRNGALDDTGNPVEGKHNAARVPVTFCAPAKHDFNWTHIMGFTLTYNDFDYTGAVFRVEQSYSTKEVIRFIPAGNGRRFNDPFDPTVLRDDFDNFTGVWRSMVGFDLFQSIRYFRYIPFLHRSFHEQAWFVSGQWLMENYWHNVANNFCQNVDNVGNGLTEEDVAEERANGFRAFSNPQCRRYRWNHLLTLGIANQGLYGSRVETRNAIAFEPRDKQYLLFSQWWWRNVLGNPQIELSAGVAWYPGSSIGESWSGLQHFADRDQFWFEFTYYLL